MKKKKNEKKGRSLGSSRNHLYSFLHYTFNTRSLSIKSLWVKDQSAFVRASRSILFDRGQSTQLSWFKIVREREDRLAINGYLLQVSPDETRILTTRLTLLSLNFCLLYYIVSLDAFPQNLGDRP